MWLTAVQEMLRTQLEDPKPEAPPGSGRSVALLRYLVWFHVSALVLVVVGAFMGAALG
jgi:hypothetical protein